MSRLSAIKALVGTGVLVVIGLSVLFIDRGDSPIADPVAASTPDEAKCKPCLRPDGSESGSGKQNAAPNVTDIALDKTEIRQPCPDAETASSGDSRIEVNVTAEDPEGDILTYNYVISGGRIVGQGRKVTWDVTKVRAGTYTITAGVDDGCGICGKTETRTLKVLDCTSTE